MRLDLETFQANALLLEISHDRCSRDVLCAAYQHTGYGPGNCILIYTASAALIGLTLKSNIHSNV